MGMSNAAASAMVALYLAGGWLNSTVMWQSMVLAGQRAGTQQGTHMICPHAPPARLPASPNEACSPCPSLLQAAGWGACWADGLGTRWLAAFLTMGASQPPSSASSSASPLPCCSSRWDAGVSGRRLPPCVIVHE